MSTQADLAGLLDDALGVLHKIEGLAVSERNRVEDGIQHARSATASMRVEAPVVAQETPDEAAVEPVEGSDAPEPAAGTAPQDAPGQETVPDPSDEPSPASASRGASAGQGSPRSKGGE